MLEWTKVSDKLPSTNEQVEVVFYAKPFEWWTGIFTPKGKYSDHHKFEYHQHWGDDKYHEIENVTNYIILPSPKRDN